MAPPSPTLSGLSVQPLLDHITALAAENAALKRDLPDQDAQVTAPEDQPCEEKEQADASTNRTESHSSQLSVGTATCTEVYMLRSQMHASGDAAVTAQRRADDLAQDHEIRMIVPGSMFREPHSAYCTVEQVQLSCVRV